MRRGHPGRGGWRGDSPRHFRPRNVGNPGFRPPRNFQPSLLETPRFPPPQRFPVWAGRPPYDGPGPSTHEDHYQDRSRFKYSRQRDERDRDNNRHYQDRSHQNSYHDQSNNYDKQNDFYVNNMGDVDQRQPFVSSQRKEQYPKTDLPPWASRTPFNRPEDATLQPDYSGHRPPASDHYEGTPSAVDNSDAFSRSVDDTVDIIRKRLQTRSDPQSQQAPLIQNREASESGRRRQSTESYKQQNIQQEQVQRRRSHRPRHNAKNNCDQIKSSIVNQLFKMDNDKIHKLMDNPNSSSKFEYAINSLITESQNSYNRHLRAAAEKSLCGSRNDVNQYDENDTIYEDTFMKQMQCILEPQDTILLEDIKPFVMAELNKVLQLNEYEHQNYNMENTDYRNYNQPSQYHDDHSSNPQTYDEVRNAHLSASFSPEPDPGKYTHFEHPGNDEENIDRNIEHNSSQNQNYNERSTLFERRPTKKIDDHRRHERSRSRERRRRSSGSEKLSQKDSFKETNPPYFDVNAEQISDEEDPFAELDKQYHVAVDHNFIEADDPTLPEYPISSAPPKQEAKHIPKISPFKTPKTAEDLKLEELQALESNIKSELLQYADDINSTSDQPLSKKPNNPLPSLEHVTIKKESVESKDREDLNKSDSSNTSTDKSTKHSSSRKRSTDQRPSHRKEKRKKSETNQVESSKQILNKNIIINVNDCAAKTSEACESSKKSIFNLYFSKGESTQVNNEKRSESCNPSISEKHVKRKESPQKPFKDKGNDSKTKATSTSSNHSQLTPKESNNSESPTKSDSTTKLKTINMFEALPKKSSVHQSVRNTCEKVSSKTPEEKVKTLPLKSISKQVVRRHVSTQVYRKNIPKSCQTVTMKTVEKVVQTDPVTIEKSAPKSTNAFERMKEIDMEIQVLLQEKFKLYNSLESNESSSGTMPTLGMTVLNMEKPGEGAEDGNVDSIVDEFTSIPVDELEQIALESVQQTSSNERVEKDGENQKPKRKIRRPKHIQDDITEIDLTMTPKKNKKSKTPNISLLEQIITDSRPLEEIISLDDFETSPVKTKNKKKSKNAQKPKTTKTKRQTTEPVSNTDYVLKECSVVLIREDLTKYMKRNLEVEVEHKPVIKEETVTKTEEVTPLDRAPSPAVVTEMVVEPPINDFHFQCDMLDVSEDIVIDSNCEMKMGVKELVSESVIEEVVLDNSQSSVVATEVEMTQLSGCRTYDYSADEDLKQDSLAVTGNGDAVLAIECIDKNFLAACLDGNVYHFSGDGRLLATLRGSNLAVTCLTIVQEKYGTTVFTGSLDSRIRYYDLETGLEKGPECNVLSPIQTMDRAWDTVFVGTRTGFVLQFECKNNLLIPVSTIKFSDQSILALRALKEGPRKVLLVAARSENVTIKDAQTGLLLRTLVGPKMTVYTLLYEDGKVYCGTSSNQIQVFDYASGTHTGHHDGGKGAVCLRVCGGLVFAGCYDGCVYVFRGGERAPAAVLRGPTVMLLSLALCGTKMIVGYKDRSLYIWKIPDNILQEMVL
ncbi:zinc finger protein 106 [Plutella xylostella]|uniref:zinc finger protein 106 n=1 Tax=Plutella xylostella TaxID=51655 RepID=UPI002032F5E6|nr:zinc finger protein 106 [Plutella xylostella]